MSDDATPRWPAPYVSPGGRVSIKPVPHSEAKVWVHLPISMLAINREQMRKIAEILLAYSETMPAGKPLAVDSYSLIPGEPIK